MTFAAATAVRAAGPDHYEATIEPVWDSTGRLVAKSRQLALVPRV